MSGYFGSASGVDAAITILDIKQSDELRNVTVTELE